MLAFKWSEYIAQNFLYTVQTSTAQGALVNIYPYLVLIQPSNMYGHPELPRENKLKFEPEEKKKFSLLLKVEFSCHKL